MRTSVVGVVVVGLMALLNGAARADDWPQWLGPNRDGVWREQGTLEKFPPSGPKVAWRAPLGTGYSGPAVAGDRVYVMDRKPADPKTPKVLPKVERVLCLSAIDGKLLWKHEYECSFRVSYSSGPRTTPLLRDGRVYTLGTMGDLLCLDAASGDVRWSKKLTKDYGAKAPVWGWSSHLLLDGDLLYSLVGGAGSAVVAFHKEDGKEAWRALTTKEICYSPPMIYEAGGTRQLIVWLCESVNGLDPASGKVYWALPYPVSSMGPAVNIATPRRSEEGLFLSSAYEGATSIQLANDKPAAKLLWQTAEKQALGGETMNVLMCTPLVRAGHAYAVTFMGALLCLDLKTNKVVWQTYQPTGGKQTDCGTAFLVQQGEGNRSVLFNDQGDLILARLDAHGYHEVSRAHILEPALDARKRHVVWSHPAFARRCVFARNDKEMVCVDMAAGG